MLNDCKADSNGKITLKDVLDSTIAFNNVRNNTSYEARSPLSYIWLNSGYNALRGQADECFTFERSEDNGATWSTVTGISGTSLVNTATEFDNGNTTTDKSTSRQHRVTYKPNGYFYGVIEELAIKITTMGAVNPQAKTEVLNSEGEWEIVGEEWNRISGWPAWNFIKMGGVTLDTATASYKINGFRITFKINGYAQNYSSSCILNSLRAFASVIYTGTNQAKYNSYFLLNSNGEGGSCVPLILQYKNTLTGRTYLQNNSGEPTLDFNPTYYNGTEGGGQIKYIAYGSDDYTSRFVFRHYRRSGIQAYMNYWEQYLLPHTDTNKTSNDTYNILTTKNTITIAQGGTGASTAAGALTSLGALPIAGGTMTGALNSSYSGKNTFSGNGYVAIGFDIKNTGGTSMFVGIGSNATYHGIYSRTLDMWIISADTTSVKIPKWGTTGSASKPVYFSDGEPIECSSSLTDYLPLNGGTMIYNKYMSIQTGKSSSNNGWAQCACSFLDYTKTTNIGYFGMYGEADTVCYMFLGPGKYNSIYNLRIYPTGKTWSNYFSGNVVSSGWIQSTKLACFRMETAPTSASAASALSIKTTNGAWCIAALGGKDNLYFVYGTDTNYNAGTNTTNNYSITPDGLFSGTAAKVKNALTIQANGSSLGTFDGSAAKTVNITYSNVGAAAASHMHTLASCSGTLAIAKGGTGSTSKDGARQNLGIDSGTSLPATGTAKDIFFLY